MGNDAKTGAVYSTAYRFLWNCGWNAFFENMKKEVRTLLIILCVRKITD